jgi:uncharacterized integral membrane protein
VTGGPPPRRGPDHLDEQQVRRLALVGVLLLAVILLIIFIVQNSDSVSVSFVFFSARISLIWVIFLSAVAGAVIALVVRRLVRRRLRPGDGGPPRSST